MENFLLTLESTNDPSLEILFLDLPSSSDGQQSSASNNYEAIEGQNSEREEGFGKFFICVLVYNFIKILLSVEIADPRRALSEQAVFCRGIVERAAFLISCVHTPGPIYDLERHETRCYHLLMFLGGELTPEWDMIEFFDAVQKHQLRAEVN